MFLENGTALLNWNPVLGRAARASWSTDCRFSQFGVWISASGLAVIQFLIVVWISTAHVRVWLWRLLGLVSVGQCGLGVAIDGILLGAKERRFATGFATPFVVLHFGWAVGGRRNCLLDRRMRIPPLAAEGRKIARRCKIAEEGTTDASRGPQNLSWKGRAGAEAWRAWLFSTRKEARPSRSRLLNSRNCLSGSWSKWSFSRT